MAKMEQTQKIESLNIWRCFTLLLVHLFTFHPFTFHSGRLWVLNRLDSSMTLNRHCPPPIPPGPGFPTLPPGSSSLPGTKELVRQVPMASTKKREIMAPSPRPVFSLRPRGMINVGGRGWVGSGQMLIDVPILEIKGKKKKTWGPQLQNSFTYTFTNSFLICWALITGPAWGWALGCTPRQPLPQEAQSHKLSCKHSKFHAKKWFLPHFPDELLLPVHLSLEPRVWSPCVMLPKLQHAPESLRRKQAKGPPALAQTLECSSTKLPGEAAPGPDSDSATAFNSPCPKHLRDRKESTLSFFFFF